MSSSDKAVMTKHRLSASLPQKKSRAASVTSVVSLVLKIIIIERKDEGNTARNTFGGHIQTGVACRNKVCHMNKDHTTDVHYTSIYIPMGPK